MSRTLLLRTWICSFCYDWFNLRIQSIGPGCNKLMSRLWGYVSAISSQHASAFSMEYKSACSNQMDACLRRRVWMLKCFWVWAKGPWTLSANFLVTYLLVLWAVLSWFLCTLCRSSYAFTKCQQTWIWTSAVSNHSLSNKNLLSCSAKELTVFHLYRLSQFPFILANSCFTFICMRRAYNRMLLHVLELCVCLHIFDSLHAYAHIETLASCCVCLHVWRAVHVSAFVGLCLRILRAGGVKTFIGSIVSTARHVSAYVCTYQELSVHLHVSAHIKRWTCLPGCMCLHLLRAESVSARICTYKELSVHQRASAQQQSLFNYTFVKSGHPSWRLIGDTYFYVSMAPYHGNSQRTQSLLLALWYLLDMLN